MKLLILIVFNRFVAKACQSFVFQTAVEKALQQFLVDTGVLNKVAMRTIEALAFTVSVAKSVRHQVEKRPIRKAEIKKPYNISAKTVVDHRAKGRGVRITASLDELC